MNIQHELIKDNSRHPVVNLLDKMTLLYEWRRMEREIKPLFKAAAKGKHNLRHQEAQAKKRKKIKELCQELFSGEIEDGGEREPGSNGGRRGSPFIAYLRAFLYAPLIYLEQNHEAIALHLETNAKYRSLCGFKKAPARRTLADFDEIMSEAGLWEKLRDMGYRVNVEKRIIKEELESTINIDPTHIIARSTPEEYVKDCRECPYFGTCENKVRTDETAGWYQKSKYRGEHAHMGAIGQLGKSGAPVERVVLNGKEFEPKSFAPLLFKMKEKNPELKLGNINVDGIFNNLKVKEKAKEAYPQAKVHSPVNAGRTKQKGSAWGISKIDPHGKVYCYADREMKYRGKDENREAFIYACPLGKKANSCPKKNLCSPNSENGRFARIGYHLLPKVDKQNPQPSSCFRMIYKLRTKIERLFARMKDRFKFGVIYQRGRKKVGAHIDKFMMVMHLLAFITGSYGV